MIFKISGLIILMGLISWVQIRWIARKDGAKGVAVYLCFMGLVVLVGILLIAGVEIPSQAAVSKLFEPLGKAVLGE